ncbi:MAG TPA: bi-domain-containing oxidoreductase [Desulfosporosinus sp.]|nr:bi-domain-containing oxidoreductase [Desulfosporosinus sp.]HUT84171.1 bi-domain-containing oxidoreductase [Thermodesulfobacteriota bacterium]
MKQVIVRQGKIVVEEIPPPQVEPGMVLVRVDHSCISAGTEMSGMRESGTPLWKRALRQPEKVKDIVAMAGKDGFKKTRLFLQGKLDEGYPTGYSASGVVLELGNGISDLFPGDRVACAGSQFAHHAEIIRVPRNLVVRIPEGVGFSEASTVTMGTIALQGVRRAVPTLGESFVVIGLGILGQITVQLLKVNGCRVIGVDLDRARIRLAEELGMDAGIHPEDQDYIEHVIRLTEGLGADGVIITAANSSDRVISAAFKVCRKKGRVVLVGDVGLKLNRADFYEKELDFFVSTSYGPGRYDKRYELEGLDYPLAYVRWTENRNMEEYLRLLSEHKILLAPLIGAIYSVEDASSAYNHIKNDAEKPLIVLLSYPRSVENKTLDRKLKNPMAKPSTGDEIRLALIGAGSYAKGMHLPNILELKKRFHLRAIASRTGNNASTTCRRFGAEYATTDYREVLEDSQVDAVLIATRHNLHAAIASAALKAGKHVLLEKPLALNEDELGSIRHFYDNSGLEAGVPLVMTGFNRRFSPIARRIREIVEKRSNPMIINYRMNAGYIPLEHWIHGAEGGGRNLGEACHIYDLFTFLTESRVATIDARSIRPSTGYYSSSDNFVSVMNFQDGSIATLTYTALGSPDHPKERMDVFVDGMVLVMDDYKCLKVYGSRLKGIEKKLQDKGQKAMLEAFAETIQRGGEWPILLWQQLQATEIAFEVERRLHGDLT